MTDPKDYTGRLCSRSFASHQTEHVDPIDVEGWGVCRGCGEVINMRGAYVPEHLADPDSAFDSQPEYAPDVPATDLLDLKRTTP
jgi:hypothetical protein